MLSDPLGRVYMFIVLRDNCYFVSENNEWMFESERRPRVMVRVKGQ